MTHFLENKHSVSLFTVQDPCLKICCTSFFSDVFDEIHVAANSFLFFAAGFETTASTLSFCLYELAINQDIQDRLREGVASVYNGHDQCLRMDALNELPYLDAVVAGNSVVYDNTYFVNLQFDEK